MARRLFLGLIFGLALAALAACGDSSGPDATPAATGSRLVKGKITVFAASSLTDAFKEIAASFKQQYPGAEVEFNFQGSPTLRAQLEQGARADVFVSADQQQMDLALKSSVVETAGSVFARNSLVIITPSANPAKLAAPGDLGRTGLKLVLAAPEVPVGGYSRQMLANMEKDAPYGSGFADRVLKNVVSNESNVKQVVAKVQLGEADAGIAYASDVTPSVAPALNVIAVPPEYNVIAEYAIAVVKGAGNITTARAWIEYVMSPDGQLVLKKYGLTPPS